MNECFLCSGTEQPLHRFCGCNTVAHHACMTRTIQCVHSHKEGCPVCKRSYRTIVEKKRSIVLRCHHVLAIDASIVLLCLADYLVLRTALADMTPYLVILFTLLFASTLGLIVWSLDIRCHLYPLYGALFPLCVQTQEEIRLLEPERDVERIVLQHV